MQKFRRVPMVAMATVMLLFLGVLYAWSMFRVQISAIFPEYTAAQLSLNFTITMIAYCLGGLFGGKISARFSQSVTVRIAAALLFTGYMAVSFMDRFESGSALILMYVFYGAMCGIGTGMGYNACVTGVSPWFPERQGLVSGILLMGFGFGSLLFGQLAEILSNAYGVLVTFRIYAVALAAVLLIGSFFLKKPSVEPASGEEEGLTPGQMMSRPSFWIYFMWNLVLAASGLLVINSSANIAVYYGMAAGFGLMVSLLNGAGRPVIGIILDRLGQLKGMFIINLALILSGVLLLITGLSGSRVTMIAGLLVVGMCYGGGVTISAKVISDLYGKRHYAVNFSLSNFCSIPAAFIGPYFSGMLQDRSGGNYTTTFLMLTIMAAFALFIILVLRYSLKKEGLVD